MILRCVLLVGGTKTVSIVSKLQRFTILFTLERVNVFSVLALFVEPLSD